MAKAETVVRRWRVSTARADIDADQPGIVPYPRGCRPARTPAMILRIISSEALPQTDESCRMRVVIAVSFDLWRRRTNDGNMNIA